MPGVGTRAGYTGDGTGERTGTLGAGPGAMDGIAPFPAGNTAPAGAYGGTPEAGSVPAAAPRAAGGDWAGVAGFCEPTVPVTRAGSCPAG
jgi:hypothetical protein